MDVDIAFSELAELCSKLAEVSSRNEKVKLLATFLSKLSPKEAEFASRFIIGKPVPQREDDRLDIGYATILDLIKNREQSLLIMKPLTLRDVMETFDKIKKVIGQGSREVKLRLLKSLFLRANDLESKWLIKSIIGEMQHGVNEGLLLEVISEMTDIDLEVIRRADMFYGDTCELIGAVREKGKDAITSATITLFRPLKPMLAEMCYDISEIFNEHEGTTLLEYKLDGARIQVHTDGNTIKIFSRRLKDVTESIPDVVEILKYSIEGKPAILDGEVIAIDKKGKPLPFQDLMRRFTRVKDIKRAMELIPLKVYLFDVLMVDGKVVIDLPCEERWRILEDLVQHEVLMKRIQVNSPKEAEMFLQESAEMGHEGIMAKHPKSTYTPGRRGKRWLKLKHVITLDVVIVAADWGHGRRKGWLSNYHLAVLDDENGKFEVVGKTFKGLTDDEFEEMTKKLLELKISEDEYTVYVKPSVVVEVAFNEVQRSAQYSSGFALRFARIVRIRDEKQPEEVDTLSTLKRIYEAQLKKKGRI